MGLLLFWHHFDGNSPRQAKVTELYVTQIGDKDICWLDVPVEHVGGVQEVEAAQQTVYDSYDVLLLTLGLIVGQYPLKITFYKLGNQEQGVELADISSGVLGKVNIQEFDNEPIGVYLVEHPEDLHLPYELLELADRVQGELDHLDGHNALGD